MENIAGSSVEIEQSAPAATSCGSGWSASGLDGPRAQVRDRADVEHDPAVGDLLQEARVLRRADPVPEPVGAEGVERAANRGWADDLARVRHRGEPELPC